MKKTKITISLLALTLITACGSTPTHQSGVKQESPKLASIKFDPSLISPTPEVIKGCSIPAPQKSSMKAPPYPEKAIRAGRTGYAILEFQVNAQGKTENAQSIYTDYPGVFDKASIDALNKINFIIEGRAATCESQKYRIAYQFSINAECAPDNFPKGMASICVSGYITRAN